jgi:hypothetical protein
MSEDTITALSVEQLRKRSDSLVENIGALRFSVERIELLDRCRLALREVVLDCRVVVEAHGHKALVKKIDAILTETVS